MGSRGHNPPGLDGRVVQVPGIIRLGALPAGPRLLVPVATADMLENKIAAQAAEIEQLARDNHKLAASHVALRQDIVAAREKEQQLKAHIRSIQTESDIQIRILLDKIAKMEADIRASESVKIDLKQAHMEAQSLVKFRQQLTAQLDQASGKLQKVRADIQTLPDLHAELDNLRHEHRRVRAIFEHEKGLNIEKVEQLKAMERNLIGMAREVDRLHEEIINAEQRARAPNLHGGAYMSSDPTYPPPVQNGLTYFGTGGRPQVQMSVGPANDGINSYGVIANGDIAGTAVSSAGIPVRDRDHNPSRAQH